MGHRIEYQTLLDKFTGNNELIKLIEECQLEEERLRESHFLRNAVYPDRRNLLMKLIFDLKMNENKGVK